MGASGKERKGKREGNEQRTDSNADFVKDPVTQHVHTSSVRRQPRPAFTLAKAQRWLSEADAIPSLQELLPDSVSFVPE